MVARTSPPVGPLPAYYDFQICVFNENPACVSLYDVFLVFFLDSFSSVYLILF